ncbi:MAG: hypothetical protein FWF28_03915, partial [Micrococcales bacterium]|nr:hypothetical protein [Micrococcales bacterium]
TTVAAVILGAGTMGWSVFGIVAARRPAAGRRYPRRVGAAAVLMIVGLAVMAAVPVTGRTLYLGVGWVIAGCGMGLIYLDTLNHVVEVPQEVDGVPPARAAAAVVLAENLAAAVTSTVAAAALGRAVDGGTAIPTVAAVFVCCAVLAAGVAFTARRVA